MNILRRLSVALILSTALLGIAACAPVALPSSPTTDSSEIDGDDDDIQTDATPRATEAERGKPSAGQATDGTIACDGRDQRISDPSVDYRFTGVCPNVELNGADLDVDLEAAEVGTLTIRGDRNEVDAADVSAIDIAGQQNSVDATSVDRIAISGNGNDVEIRGAAGSVVVNGNQNEVEARALGAVSDNGDGNRISTD